MTEPITKKQNTGVYQEITINIFNVSSGKNFKIQIDKMDTIAQLKKQIKPRLDSSLEVGFHYDLKQMSFDNEHGEQYEPKKTLME